MIDQGNDLLSPPQSRVRKIDAATLLTFYVFFLIAIPSRLIFAPLGGAGAPSTILGAILFGWYLLNWLQPSSKVDTGPQPMRRTAILFLCAILASYISANQHTLPCLA